MSALLLQRSGAPLLRIVFAAALSVAACSDDSPESSEGSATGEDAGQSQGGAGGKGGSGGKAAANNGSAGKPSAGGSAASSGGAGGKSAAAGSGGDAAGNKPGAPSDKPADKPADKGGKAGAGGAGGKASAAGSGGSHQDADAGIELDDAGAAVLPQAYKINFSATECFGTCPVYSVSLDQDGNVEFDGQSHVAKSGKSTKQVTPNAAADVYEALLGAGYFELKDAYRTEADGCKRVRTDSPTHNWSVERDGKKKNLLQYLGCEGVASLDKVEAVSKLLIQRSGIADWIGSNN